MTLEAGEIIRVGRDIAEGLRLLGLTTQSRAVRDLIALNVQQEYELDDLRRQVKLHDLSVYLDKSSGSEE